MSERRPRLTAREIIRVLERRGFFLARSSGSHLIYKNTEGRRVTVAGPRRPDAPPESFAKYLAGHGPDTRRT